MGDRGGPDGDQDRGPGLDTTLQDSDIESNWDQVLFRTLSSIFAHYAALRCDSGVQVSLSRWAKLAR